MLILPGWRNGTLRCATDKIVKNAIYFWRERHQNDLSDLQKHHGC